MRALLRVLQVEDSESDAALILRALQQAGYAVQSERVETAEELREALSRAETTWDAIIADYRLPQFDAPSALRVLKESGLDLPFIVVSGTIGEELAVEMMRAGAHDYLMKGSMVRLGPVVEREIGEARSRAARREAERQLHESGERLAMALTAARMGVWQWDMVSDRVFWSRECHEILHVHDFDGTQRAFLEIVHPEDREPLQEAGRRAIVERRSFSHEFRVIQPDGKIVWLSNVGHARFNESGRATQLLGIIQDITERKRAEGELLHSQTMLDSVVRSALDAVIVIDNEGRIVHWNPAAERMFGYDSSEVIGRRLHDLVAPARFHADFLRGYRSFLESGTGPIMGKILEVPAVRRNGVEFPVELGVAPINIGGAMFAVGMVRDITARKASETALRESEQRWSFALEGAGDGVWDWDGDTGLTFYSRQWKAMLGLAEDEMRTGDFADLIHPDDRERAQAAIEDHLTGKSASYTAEYRLRCKDGSYKWILARGRVVTRSADGRPLRAIGTHTDLSRLKAAEAEREKLLAQFLQAQKMESVGRLAGGVAHDFNNLLTIINGYAVLLRGDPDCREPQRDSLDQVIAAGERAKALVGQLLSFSRKDPPSQSAVNVNTLVENMGKTVLRLIGEDVRMSTTLAASLPTVKADPNQLEQVLMNLAVNARDAMPNGGTLTIETGVRPEAALCEICGQQIFGEHHVFISVRDTGVGMSEEARSHLFEPFFTTKPVGQGTGLGLSVVHGIVTANSGHLVVQSEAGKGTEFRVYLPVMQAEQAVDQAPAGVAPEGTEVILLVEDDPNVRRYVTTALTRLGYRVLEAPNAEDALATLQSQRPDLMLTDIVMPGMSGRELASKARQSVPGLKVLFMSGYTGGTAAESPEPIPNEEFLQKPFLPDELGARLRQLLGSKPKLARSRVLVVDDEAAIRRYLRSVLEPVGCEVEEAANGKQAIEVVKRRAPDLIITDLVMPEKEGIETILSLKQSYPMVRILAISGAAGGQYLETAKYLGADGVMRKPVGPAELAAKVREMLGAR